MVQVMRLIVGDFFVFWCNPRDSCKKKWSENNSKSILITHRSELSSNQQESTLISNTLQHLVQIYLHLVGDVRRFFDGRENRTGVHNENVLDEALCSKYYATVVREEPGVWRRRSWGLRL